LIAGVLPWSFRAADHRDALKLAHEAGVSLRPLRGEAPDTVWDPDLRPSSRASGVEVEEERVLDGLLADLCQE
jgi:Protein of unknown function C-terminus (DUF2399)